MYGRQGDPIYTQADWSGVGNAIAQERSGSRARLRSLKARRHSSPSVSAPGAARRKARSHHSASPSARPRHLERPHRRPIADERRAFAARKADEPRYPAVAQLRSSSGPDGAEWPALLGQVGSPGTELEFAL